MADQQNLNYFTSGGWLNNAIQRPSPNFNNRPPDTEIDMLVIHNISLPPGDFGGSHIEDFFLNRLNSKLHPYFAEISSLKVSAHFLVNRKGAVIQFISVYDRAWHAGESCWLGRGNCNDFSLGIELEGCDERPFSQQQYDSLARLTRIIRQQFPAISVARIVGHSDIAPGRKTDPGPLFNWQRFRASIS